MKKLSIVSTTAIALLIACLSFNAFASPDDKAATAEAQKNAAISLTQAVTIAEQVTGGKSKEAEFDLEHGTAIYEVEIRMPDGSEIEVEVDAQSGAILKQKAERGEHDGGHEKHESDDHKNKAEDKS